MDKLAALADNLKRQYEIQRKLLELETQKKDILLKGDVEALNTLMISEQSTIMESSGLEKQREKLQDGSALQGKNLRAIVEEYGADNAYSLSTLFSDLCDTVIRLKKINMLNKKLLQSRLQTLKHVSAALGIGTQPVVYKKG